MEPLHPLEGQGLRDVLPPEQPHTSARDTSRNGVTNGSTAPRSEDCGSGAKAAAAAGGLGGHSVHVVTQYYVPGDPRRAHEVCEILHRRHRFLSVPLSLPLAPFI